METPPGGPSRPCPLQWVVSLFSISAGSFMLLGGRACDVLGARRVLMGSLAVCAVGGMLTGAAPSVARVRVERGSDDPLLPARRLRARRLVGSCLAFGAYCAGYTALVVVGSLFVQSEYGLGAAGAGLFLTPMLVVGTVSAVLAPRVVRRHGVRRVTSAALLTCAAAMLGVAVSRPEDPALLLPWLVLWAPGQARCSSA